ncbi:hypothetical protein HK100_010141 [Physocladia obscura]|uniref:BZIP domain-containing protein n=1 Tax=Physocladia obscura TaxID=109957 RepID=A0AAD5SLD9_9FUNG|nr:hypothetical protein HK100_010141 [Physocladia obscura]
MNQPESKKCGRKPVPFDGTNKRQEQMRAAQRLHRERRQKHVEELEKTVEVLSAQLQRFEACKVLCEKLQNEVSLLRAALRLQTVRPANQRQFACPNCAAEQLRADLLREQLAQHERKQHQQHQLHPLSGKQQYATMPQNRLLLQQDSVSWNQSQNEVFCESVEQEIWDSSNVTAMLDLVEPSPLTQILSPLHGQIFSNAEFQSAIDIFGPLKINVVKVAFLSVPSLSKNPESVNAILDAFVVSIFKDFMSKLYIYICFQGNFSQSHTT